MGEDKTNQIFLLSCHRNKLNIFKLLVSRFFPKFIVKCCLNMYTSPHAVVLSVFFRMRSQRLSEFEKHRILFYRFDNHKTFAFIAHRMKCSVETVHRVCTQHKNHVDTERMKHHGRRAKLNQSQINHLFNIIRNNNNMTSTELSRHLFIHDNIDISSRTVSRYRRRRFHPATEIIIPRFI